VRRHRPTPCPTGRADWISANRMRLLKPGSGCRGPFGGSGMSRLPPILFCVGVALAALGALLFVRPSLGLGGAPPQALFLLAALSLAAAAFCSPKRMRWAAAVCAVLCVLAMAGLEFDRHRAARRGLADEERLKQVLPLETADVSLGGPAPEVEGADLSGRAMRLSEHRGKVVLLVFWATWCGPCMGDVPHEKALVERFAGRPFVLVGVNADADAGRAAPPSRSTRSPGAPSGTARLARKGRSRASGASGRGPRSTSSTTRASSGTTASGATPSTRRWRDWSRPPRQGPRRGAEGSDPSQGCLSPAPRRR
jgi:thiol-disulfide isomerase/thioredoxin